MLGFLTYDVLFACQLDHIYTAWCVCMCVCVLTYDVLFMCQLDHICTAWCVCVCVLCVHFYLLIAS